MHNERICILFSKVMQKYIYIYIYIYVHCIIHDLCKRFPKNVGKISKVCAETNKQEIGRVPTRKRKEIVFASFFSQEPPNFFILTCFHCMFYAYVFSWFFNLFSASFLRVFFVIPNTQAAGSFPEFIHRKGIILKYLCLFLCYHVWTHSLFV